MHRTRRIASLATFASLVLASSAYGDAQNSSIVQRYRFVHTPVVVYAMLPGPVYHVAFRLNHYLIRDRRGLRASVELNETGDPTKPTNFARPRACYLQELEPGPPDPVLRHPRSGRSVTVTLRVKAPEPQTITAKARLRRVSRTAFDAPDGAGAFGRLGC
jgi:hypothetical protein